MHTILNRRVCMRAGTVVAAKADDARMVVSALPAQAAAGENERPDAYVQAPQGLFPAPMHPSAAAGALTVLANTTLRVYIHTRCVSKAAAEI